MRACGISTPLKSNQNLRNAPAQTEAVKRQPTFLSGSVAGLGAYSELESNL